MHHSNMINIFTLLFGLVFASVVRGEIDLLAEPEELTLDYAINGDNNDLLREIEYDLLRDDLLSAIELGGEVYSDVMVGDDGDIADPSSLLVDDGTTITAAVGEGPEGEAAATGDDIATSTEENVPSTHTTDPRLERFAERLQLLTLPPDERKRRKIELQLQKISVQNTEDREKKKAEKKQKRIERREKKKQEKLEKMKGKKEKSSEKISIQNTEQERKKEEKKLKRIDRREKKRQEKLEKMKGKKEKSFEKKKDQKGKISGKKKDSKKNTISTLPEEIKDNKFFNTKEFEKLKKREGIRRKREDKKLENVEKRKAKHLRKGKERNLKILQNMIDKEEKGVPSMNKRNTRNIQSRKKSQNRNEYQRNKHDIKKWKKNKERIIKRRKEIRFLLRLKRGFGTRLDNEHKKEVAQQLRKLKRKYKNDKKILSNFQKNNWELIEESKLFSKLNRLKKKISYIRKKRKQYVNVANSDYKTKLSKRMKYFQNKYKEIKEKIKVMEKFNAKSRKNEKKYEKRNPSGYYAKIQKLKSKIKALIKMKKHIGNEPDLKYELKLKEQIKKLVEKYKKYRRMEKIRNETKKERKTRKIKEKMKSLKKMSKKGGDSMVDKKLSKRINDLMERYKKMRNIIKYEKRNKCYLREDHDSRNFLKMQNLKEEIKSLKDKRRQIGSKGDPIHRTKLRKTIINLVKKYKNYKRSEIIRNETKTERKNRKLREEISSLMKMRRKSEDQNVKTNLSKRIKKLVKHYKKTRKIIKYENKYECRYFSKLQNVKEKTKLLISKRNQINFDTDSKQKIQLTKRIRNLNKVYTKYSRTERIRNETENERKLRKLKEEIKSLSKMRRSSADLNIKTKLTKRIKSLLKRYRNIRLIVKYEAKNMEEIRRSYEIKNVSKYYARMEKLKLNIKSLISKKRQIGNEIDPKYKLKLMKRITKLVNMYKKYKRMEKIKTETKKEMKSRKLKEKIKYLNIKKKKSMDANVKTKLSKIINGLKEKHKKIHNIVKYEKKNKCYIREDYGSKNYIKMEKLKGEIKSLIMERRQLGSEGDPKQKIKLIKRIRSLIKKYKNYRRMEKIKNETKNERKNRNLKEKIKILMKMRRQSKDQNIRTDLSKRIKLLVKRYKKMHKIIKYENKYECRNFSRAQKVKEIAKELIRKRRQISGDKHSQQKIILSKRITKLIKRYKKYNSMEKIRKETENGRKMRKLKDEIKSLAILQRKAPDLNEKTKLLKKIRTLKNSYTNIRLIVKYEEKDMEQISRSYERRIQSKYYVRMQKLKPKIISLRREKRQPSNKVDPEYKSKLTKKIENLIRKYKNYKRSEKYKNEPKYERKNRKLKEKIKSLVKIRDKTNDTKIKSSLSNKIKRLIKKYKRTRMIVKDEKKLKSPKNKNLERKRRREAPQNKYLERKRRRALRQRKKYNSSKHNDKLEGVAKRKRQQRKLRLRRRKERRERMKVRRHQDTARSWQSTCRRRGGCENDPVLPEGLAYCKSKQSNSGGSCQCWYVQNQM